MVAQMDYYMASGCDRSLPLKVLARRYKSFAEVHQREQKFQMAIHGAKPKR